MSESAFVVDEKRYGAAARVLSKKFIQTLARSLNDIEGIDIDLADPSPEHIDNIFNSAFLLLAVFEHGVPLKDSDEGFAYVVFGVERQPAAPQLGSSSRSILHGGLDDNLIKEALAELVE